jgi:hypothetical protein
MKFIFCSVIVLPAMLFAQNTAVQWSSFNMGFARSSAAGWQISSAVGQNFVGGSSYANTKVTSGLLADTLLRGTVVSVHGSNPIPVEYSLSQNYPNPFNPTTIIQFTIVNRQLTIVKVYDVLGREVSTLVNEVKGPGTYTVQFDASNLASGVYFYRLQAGDFTQTKRLLLLK